MFKENKGSDSQNYKGRDWNSGAKKIIWRLTGRKIIVNFHQPLQIKSGEILLMEVNFF